MSVKVENQNKLAKLSSNHFLTANSKLSGNNLLLRARTQASLITELKMKVAWNTCDKELGFWQRTCDKEQRSLSMKITSKVDN